MRLSLQHFQVFAFSSDLYASCYLEFLSRLVKMCLVMILSSCRSFDNCLLITSIFTVFCEVVALTWFYRKYSGSEKVRFFQYDRIVLISFPLEITRRDNSGSHVSF